MTNATMTNATMTNATMTNFKRHLADMGLKAFRDMSEALTYEPIPNADELGANLPIPVNATELDKTNLLGRWKAMTGFAQYIAENHAPLFRRAIHNLAEVYPDVPSSEAGSYLLAELERTILYDRYGRNTIMLPLDLAICLGQTDLSEEVMEGFSLPYPYTVIEQQGDTGFLVMALGLDEDFRPTCNPEYLVFICPDMFPNASPMISMTPILLPRDILVREVLTSNLAEEGQTSVLKMLVSFCLWISDPQTKLKCEAGTDPDGALERLGRKLATTSSESKQRHIQKRITKLNIGSVWTPDFDDDSKGKTGSRVSEHWVRGHWRLQWYGSEENRVQKPCWIKPHRRGIGQGDTPQERVYVP